jgi:hypothetical protein
MIDRAKWLGALLTIEGSFVNEGRQGNSANDSSLRITIYWPCSPYVLLFPL